MNDKEKQIEELARLMADCNTTCDECFEKYERVTTMKIKEREKHCQVYAYAQRAVEQGYRKIPEGAVVLAKEEYEKLKNKPPFAVIKYDEDKMKKIVKEAAKTTVFEFTEKGKDEIRKETAKEFAEKLKDRMNDREYMGIRYKQGVFSDNDINELLKEYEK